MIYRLLEDVRKALLPPVPQFSQPWIVITEVAKAGPKRLEMRKRSQVRLDADGIPFVFAFFDWVPDVPVPGAMAQVEVNVTLMIGVGQHSTITLSPAEWRRVNEVRFDHLLAEVLTRRSLEPFGELTAVS